MFLTLLMTYSSTIQDTLFRCPEYHTHLSNGQFLSLDHRASPLFVVLKLSTLRSPWNRPLTCLVCSRLFVTTCPSTTPSSTSRSDQKCFWRLWSMAKRGAGLSGSKALECPDLSGWPTPTTHLHRNFGERSTTWGESTRQWYVMAALKMKFGAMATVGIQFTID